MIIEGDAKKMYGLLYKLQSLIPVVPKSATNPHFKSKYADLPTIMEILKPILQENGLVLLQPVYSSATANMLEIGTIIIDSESGSSISVTSTLPIGNNSTPQAFGSAITYARRYVLCSLLGIVADEDDDGNAGSGVTSKESSSKKQSAAASTQSSTATSGISVAQVQRLYTIAKSAGYTQEEVLAILSKRGIYNAKQLTEENYNKFCLWLEANVKGAHE